MSKLIEVRDLHLGDLFETQNGSVYTITARVESTGAWQARLWCAHPPDDSTFEPPLVLFPPEQQVGLLEANETREHYRHPGYTQAVFAVEMDRRHQAAMNAGAEKRQQTAAAQAADQHERRPWWKKLWA
jgi:hypothetical protein